MKTMHLVHISYTDLGNNVTLMPTIPMSRVDTEDSITPRVCAALTIAQCVYSKFIYIHPYVRITGSINFYVYACDVPTEDIIQPTMEQVDDVWMTGELWVTKPHTWKKVGEYALEIGTKVYAKDHYWRYNIHTVSQQSITPLHPEFAFDGVADNFWITESGPIKHP